MTPESALKQLEALWREIEASPALWPAKYRMFEQRVAEPFAKVVHFERGDFRLAADFVAEKRNFIVARMAEAEREKAARSMKHRPQRNRRTQAPLRSRDEDFA